ASKSPGTIVHLKGKASHTGDRAHNQKLSEKRVQVVKQFLAGEGVRTAQIVIAAVGFSEAPIVGDDKRDRSVRVEMEHPPRKAGPGFDHIIRFDASDGLQRTPPHVMVPSGFFRKSLFVDRAEGMKLRVVDPNIAALVSPDTNLDVDELVPSSDHELIRIE